ncbi:PIR protein [Plasmodium yoelii]|uniref:PIR protein n=2 Tax=Plasmodium yoelii TaxID=5861 RepID=A0AAE9WQQ1_PLAYO|nr:PIR protein [Plasmodium yoelii]WBY56975.1 PIR protein [Plasmodium yoelii yoelii]CDU17769.1 YIR protein [Plasmodium yoelii]VTZ77818.1 PIR protein [Plasmodium yoelii]|eukprot:XP_022812076.1 PIR protein [Plasmodium yoelii]
MDDDICGNFVVLRTYLPDELGESAKIDFKSSSSLKKYCPNGNCNTNLDKIMAGFLWLFEENCSKFQKTPSDENKMITIFLYIISWLSYKLNQNSEYNFTTINDFYTKHVNDNQQYTSIINDVSKCTNFKKIIDKQKDFLNINIEDMSNFYDAFKLLCNIHDNVTRNVYDNTLSGNAIHFFNKYSEINDYYNIENTLYSKILSFLSTDYNNLKTKCDKNLDQSKKFPILPTERATKTFLRQSSIQISVVPMTFIFCALLIYLGIVYKRSSFDFRKRIQKLNLRIKKITKKINH